MIASAASAPCAFAKTFAGGCRSNALKLSNNPAAASAKVAASATTRREADSAASSGTTTSQIAANEPMPPVHQAGERERGHHVRTYVTAGAREEIGDHDRRHQPAEDAEFERTRHPAHGDIDRKAGKRCKAAEQARRDEGAVARRRQRILLRRRVHQGVDVIPHWREETHGSCHTSCTHRRAPFS